MASQPSTLLGWFVPPVITLILKGNTSLFLFYFCKSELAAGTELWGQCSEEVRTAEAQWFT